MSAAHMSEELKAYLSISDDPQRCCFVCGRAATNPALLFTDAPMKFQNKAKPEGRTRCLRFGGQPVFCHQACGLFVHRDDFEGWPALPPSIHERDRWRDAPGAYEAHAAAFSGIISGVYGRRHEH